MIRYWFKSNCAQNISGYIVQWQNTWSKACTSSLAFLNFVTVSNDYRENFTNMQFVLLCKTFHSADCKVCAVADPKILKRGRWKTIYQPRTVFIANAYNDLYALYTKKTAFRKHSDKAAVDWLTSYGT